jgi:CBS domain-containing protein
MTIGRILASRSFDVVTCDAGCTVSEAIDLLAQHRIGALPVVEADSVLGIFSERDVIYLLREHGSRALTLAVRDAMTAPAVTVEPATEALEALSLMTRRRIRHLPVIEHGRMTGFVSIGDLVKYRIEKIQSEAEAMRSYIQTA